MGRWLQAQLKQGALGDGKRLFGEAALQAMWTPQTLIPLSVGSELLVLGQPQFEAYALGLSSPDWIANYKKVFDQGNEQAGQALLASKAAFHPESGPSLPLSGYAGIYRDPWYGTATISQGKGALNLSFDRSPGMHGKLEHVQYDTFRTHWATPGMEDAYVTFALHPDGSIDQMTMQAISPAADFSWDYQDLLFTP